MSYQPVPLTDPNEQPPPYQPPAQPQPPPGQYYPAPNQYPPPQGQYPPPQRQYPPPQGQYPPQYYPLPPQYAPQPMQQQSSNVVVVGAQPTAPTVVVTHQPRAPDYLTLTVIGFALCFLFGGIVGMLFMIPALVCSLMAQDANSNGDYENARSLGKASLIWNIFVYSFYAVAITAVVIAVVVVRVEYYCYYC